MTFGLAQIKGEQHIILADREGNDTHRHTHSRRHSPRVQSYGHIELRLSTPVVQTAW